MIGIDTNVLLRLLLADDPSQAKPVQQEFSRADAGGQQWFVCDVVLTEVVWTLRSRYGASKVQLLEGLRSLLDNARLVFESRSALADAVDRYAHSAAGFADCLIVGKNAAAGCSYTLTFDRALRGFEHAKIL